MEQPEPRAKKTVHRNKPMLAASVEKWLHRQVYRWAEQSGLTLSRVVSEMIQHCINTGYRPGHVSVRRMSAEATASLQTQAPGETRAN